MGFVLTQLKRLGLFLWDPEGSVSLDADKPVARALLAPLTLLFLVVAAALMYRQELAHLTCWTPKFYGSSHLAALLLGWFLLVWAADNVVRGRSTLILFGSLTLSIFASLPLTLLSFGVLFPYWAVARSRLPAWCKHLTVVLLLGAVMALYSFHLFPEVVFSPIWGGAGVMFAFFLPLRLIWYHFQASRERFDGVTLSEVLTYFFLAPAPFILPYMFALPRREEMRAITAPTEHTKALGTLYIFTGLAFYLAYHLLDGLIMAISKVPGMRFVLFPWGYPFEPVFWALGSSYIITGMYNRLGAKVSLAFRSPLKSPSVLEWWRRWNVHFRDMLVDMFFYPLVLGKRKHPYLRIWLAVFGVFIVGSTILHWGVKHYFMNSAFVPYWSMFVENGVMFLAVGVLLHLEKYQLARRMELRKEARKEGKRLAPPKQRPLVLRLLAYPATYFVVFISVVGGYATNLIVEGTYVDRPTAMVRYSRSLRSRGETSRADYYRQLAIADFENRLKGHTDLSSPWRIKERHGAMKLALIYASLNEREALSRVVALLRWPPALLSLPEGQRGYPALRGRVRHELVRLKGMGGVKALVRGEL